MKYMVVRVKHPTTSDRQIVAIASFPNINLAYAYKEISDKSVREIYRVEESMYEVREVE